RPIEWSAHEGFDRALRGGLEALERLHDLTAGKDLDPEPPAAHLLNDLRQPVGRALHVERAGPGRRQSPLYFRLGDDVGRVDERRSGYRRGDTGCLPEKSTSLRHDVPATS